MIVSILQPPPFEGSLEEMREHFADLLESLTKQHVHALIDVGVGAQEFFLLRRLARQYRFGNVSCQDYQAMQKVLPKLESVNIAW